MDCLICLENNVDFNPPCARCKYIVCKACSNQLVKCPFCALDLNRVRERQRVVFPFGSEALMPKVEYFYTCE